VSEYAAAALSNYQATLTAWCQEVAFARENNGNNHTGPIQGREASVHDPLRKTHCLSRSDTQSYKASGRSKLTRKPKQIDAQLGKQTGAELSALFVRRCLVPPSGLCRPVWISRMTKPAEDRVACEFNPAGRLTGPCDNFFN